MNVCDEWMWCGVDVVCVRGAGGEKGYARHGKCVVSAECVRCTECKVRVAWRCKWWLVVCVVCVRCVLCAGCGVV